MKASVVSKMQVMLPEFGIVDLGRVEYNKVDYKDLSTVPASSPLDSEGDGIKLITMERLASEDNDGDDSKLTVPCTVTYLNDNTISSDINMSILLPDVAAAWGDNSHIKNAVFNPNNTGRLVVINAPAGQKETLNIIARSNKIVPHVRYIIAEVQYDGKYITLGQSEDKSIEPGIDVNMEVPIEFKKAGTYELKIYALVTGP
jgi:hypothetical protein